MPVDTRGTVAPFVGARLRDWAARCLASPYGFVYTRVSDWQSTTLQTADGEALEVAEIGSMTPDPAKSVALGLRLADHAGPMTGASRCTATTRCSASFSRTALWSAPCSRHRTVRWPSAPGTV